MTTYTYRTDAIHCDTEYQSIDEAVAAAIAEGEWDGIGGDREQQYIDDGAWLCVYADGVPEFVRGTMG